MARNKDSRTRRFPYGKVHQPQDFGDERVATLEELVMRDPVPASDAMPAEFQRMLDADRTIRHVETDGGPPDVRIVQKSVGQGPRGTMWTVELDSDNSVLWNGRPGLDHAVEKIDTPGAAGNALRYGQSYRPPWRRTEFLPRMSPLRDYMPGMDRYPAISRNRPGMQTMDYVGEGWVVGWPWTCIGKVEGGFDTDFNKVIVSGTGVLVGRNIVLTAAHLAIWGRGPGRWWMRFTPGFDILLPSLGSSFVEQFRGPGPQSTPNANDWVLCKLFQPLGDALGFFGYHWSSNDNFYYNQRWMSAGYPAFKYGGQRLISEYDIQVQDIDNDGDGREIEIALNDFLLNGGWSGGPLWGWFPGDDPRVIGVTSGFEMDGWDPVRTVFVGGGPILNLLQAKRTEWSP